MPGLSGQGATRPASPRRALITPSVRPPLASLWAAMEVRAGRHAARPDRGLDVGIGQTRHLSPSATYSGGLGGCLTADRFAACSGVTSGPGSWIPQNPKPARSTFDRREQRTIHRSLSRPQHRRWSGTSDCMIIGART